MPKKSTITTADTPETQVEATLPMRYDVRIKSLKNGNVKADVDVNINGGFAVRGITVKDGKNGLFVSMPYIQLRDESYRDVCYPCTTEARTEFDRAVLDAYQNALTQGLGEAERQNAEPLPLEYKVRIYFTRPGESSLKGTASVSLNDQFAIGKVSIMESSKGLFVSMPRFNSFKGFRDYCFPCTKESHAEFTDAVLGAYKQTLAQNQETGQRLASSQDAPDPFAAQAQDSGPVLTM